MSSIFLSINSSFNIFRTASTLSFIIPFNSFSFLFVYSSTLELGAQTFTIPSTFSLLLHQIFWATYSTKEFPYTIIVQKFSC